MFVNRFEGLFLFDVRSILDVLSDARNLKIRAPVDAKRLFLQNRVFRTGVKTYRKLYQETMDFDDGTLTKPHRQSCFKTIDF